MNLGEHGVSHRHAVGFDISGQTALTLTYSKPSGATLIKTTADGVAVGTVTEDGFTANHYCTYSFAPGDVDEAGTWKVRLQYDAGAGKRLISSVGSFVVSA